MALRVTATTGHFMTHKCLISSLAANFLLLVESSASLHYVNTDSWVHKDTTQQNVGCNEVRAKLGYR